MDDMALAKIWLDRKVKHPENTTQKMADFIARIRAEARAEALIGGLRSASKIVKETAIEMGLDDEEVFSISGIIDPDIPGNLDSILAYEPKEERGAGVKSYFEMGANLMLGSNELEDKQTVMDRRRRIEEQAKKAALAKKGE